MSLDDLRRRPLIGAAVAALTGLAGCNGPNDEAATTNAAATSGREDAQQLPEHDHSGADDGGSRLGPAKVDADRVETAELTAMEVAGAQVNGDVYTAAMPGEDLSTKVRNAVAEVPDGRAVVVTPRPDGEPWQWTDTLRINLQETGGVSLLFRGTTMVEYTGDGWALDVTREPADYGQLPSGNFLRLRGGYWEATGNPDGWLR